MSMRVQKRQTAATSLANGAVRSMKPPRALVYALLARLLQTSEASVNDADALADLELDALDLVLVAIKLEEIEPDNGPFPLGWLAHATTVADLVELVESWWRGDRIPDSSTPGTSVM